MIELQGVTFAYRGGPAIFRGFSWRVERGESWAVIGPSGCGKTTLLYLLAGLRRPQEGRVVVEGLPLERPRPQTGLVLQDYGLLPWATALENILLGMRIVGVPRRERERRAAEWLCRLGLEGVAHHYPAQLSGGQRQRVALARTLALRPDLLLLDEPFSSLDALTREEMQDLCLSLGVGRGLTTVLVTHSIEEAVFLGRWVMVLGQPPISRAVVVNNPEAGDPAYRASPAFHRRCNLLREQVQEVRSGALAG